MASLVAAWHASRLPLCPAWRAALPQTLSGSELFSLEQRQDLEHQLNDAIALKGRQCNQLTGGSDDDPEGGVGQKFHGHVRG